MSRSMWIKAALVTLGTSLVPVSYALADAGGKPTAAEKAEKEKKLEKHFPMPAAKFDKRVEKRILKARARLTERMDDRRVPAEKRKEIYADFEASAAKVRAAAQTAGKDGTVTLDEAKQIRELAKQSRKDLRKKYHLGGKRNGKKKGTPAGTQ